jgi:hypothetical protein
VRRATLVAGIPLLLLALVAGGALLAAISIDPDDFRQPLQTRLGAALERPVALGEMDLAFLPLPALRIRDVRIADASGAEPPLAEVDEVRLRLALLPLLVGRVELAAAELEGPTLRLELDASGLPVLPALGRARVPGARDTAAAVDAALSAPRAVAFERAAVAAPGGSEGVSRGSGAGQEPLALALSGIRVSRGRVSAGPWTLSNVSLVGELSRDRTASLSAAADLPGLADLRDVRVSLEGLGTDAVVARATGRVVVARAEALAGLAPAAEGWTGGADAHFDVELSRGELGRLAVSLDCEDLALASAGFRAAGRVSLAAEPGGLVELDGTEAELALGERFRKPKGTRASAAGPLGDELPPRALRSLELTLGSESTRLDVDLRGSSPRLDVGPGTIRLEALAPLLGSEPGAISGTLHLEPAGDEARPAWLSGRVRLERATLRGAHGPLSVSGPVDLEGSRLSSSGLRVVAGGQTTSVRGHYDVARDELMATAEIAGADVQPLVAALAGRRDLGGTLAAGFELSALNLLGEKMIQAGGSGRLEIRDGSLRGFSIMRHALGELAALPELVAQLNGLDLSQYDEGRFELLSGDFTLLLQRLHTDNLRIVHRSGTAELRGWINLLTGQLSMYGELVLSDELSRTALSRTADGHPRVIPIDSVQGTLARPRVRLDTRALGDLVAEYLADGDVRARLEEKLGRGSADLVEGIVRSFFPATGPDSGPEAQ